MLIRFSVENFMSFKQQQVFSMAAGKGSRHPSHVVLANNNRLLKSSFIFGANAAGKSNFIHAVDFMRRIVISGAVINTFASILNAARCPVSFR